MNQHRRSEQTPTGSNQSANIIDAGGDNKLIQANSNVLSVKSSSVCNRLGDQFQNKPFDCHLIVAHTLMHLPINVWSPRNRSH